MCTSLRSNVVFSIIITVTASMSMDLATCHLGDSQRGRVMNDPRPPPLSRLYERIAAH